MATAAESATRKVAAPRNRLIGPMPRIGIRPAIDGRRKGVRESLERQTLEMARSVARLLESSAGRRRQLEDARHGERLRAVADQLARRPGAAQQRERVDDQRLARAGPPGQDVEAAAELHLAAGEHREVPDVETLEHGGGRRLAVSGG